ncbi:lipoprotein [Actinokineospora auranticolor]|uniref:Uncharacterized protein n=1 Tax=Actinokineospora auranticolor TaxID=155976 RepID=A0A2S6GD66_9PSEU|nr:lipoprotein [Actinokineospora auranticolor]PPK63188.1 hypothetical protein CLV40_13157 [Actinokineospora auranticolor]
MRTAVVAVAACLVLAGCGSGKADMWAEVEVPKKVTDTEDCFPVGVVDVPADWTPINLGPRGESLRFGLKAECDITSDHAAGVVKVYQGSRLESDTGERLTDREVLEAYLEVQDASDVEIREAKVGRAGGFEAVWRTNGKPNRAFTYTVYGGSHTMLVAALGAPDDKFEETVLPVYLLARKSAQDSGP